MGKESDFPILPGYNAKAPYSEFGHHRHQTLSYEKGYALKTLRSQEFATFGAAEAPQDTSESLPGSQVQEATHATQQLSASRVPKWIENDRKVLRWFGYFKEEVHDNPEERLRIRRIHIHYYLEDDTLDVTEPKQENSGIPQGMLVKRHRIPNAAGSPFKSADLHVGGTATICGRTYFIVGMDGFTRSFLGQHGIELAPDEPYPEAPFDVRQSAHNRTGSPARIASVTGHITGPLTTFRLKDFLENSKKVLRFYLIWDDRKSLYGDRRPYRLHYFLEDGACEVLESRENNSGRDPFPVFLRKGLLPKNGQPPKPGYYPEPSMCYGPADLRIGTYIFVYGRNFFIHDCDDFTRKWLQEHLNHSEEELLPVDVKEPVPTAPGRQLPEYNGFGSLEDSAQNCTSLIPRPPRKDFYRLMNKERTVLRFGCCLLEGASALSPTDRERRFVLSFFMADDSLAIYEPPIKNSGVVGGKYLERRKISWPNSERSMTDADLYVGACLPILQRNFKLLEADEYTYQYMENNRHIYKMADAEAAVQLLRQAAAQGESLKRRMEEACASTGQLTVAQFQDAIHSSGVAMSEHQIISIYRSLPKDEAQRASISSIMQILGL